jgi:TatD DNase family protein
LIMVFTDSHAHIYLPEFDIDRANILQSAEKEGVKYIFMPAIDSSTHEIMLRTHDEEVHCISMIGLHPCSVKDNYKEELHLAEQYLARQKFAAIGETGLDFYWDLAWKDQQYLAFRQQIEWASGYDLAIVIHSRESIDECIRVITENQKGELRGVFHCFSGSIDQAKQIIDLGFYLGIGGVLTYKNSGLADVIKKIDLRHLLLETDSPYLTPVPFRGKRNQPSYIRHVANKLATVKDCSVEEIATITTRNAMELYRQPDNQ